MENLTAEPIVKVAAQKKAFVAFHNNVILYREECCIVGCYAM
jgi:hypothetical protein